MVVWHFKDGEDIILWFKASLIQIESNMRLDENKCAFTQDAHSSKLSILSTYIQGFGRGLVVNVYIRYTVLL